MKIFLCLMFFLVQVSCVREVTDKIKNRGDNLIENDSEKTLDYEKNILGKWEGSYDGNAANFVMMENNSLYFYSKSIDEMNLFKDSQANGGIIKPIKWSISENKYLTFTIYDEAKNYEIIELTEKVLTLKNMIQNQTLFLNKGTLSGYELDYIKINNYNK